MERHDGFLIGVQSEWSAWRVAQVRLEDLENIHWFQPHGAPKPLAHAYISCASIITGTIPHQCERTPAPHRLLVCILKSHCPVPAYVKIARRADEQSPHTFGAPA